MSALMQISAQTELTRVQNEADKAMTSMKIELALAQSDVKILQTYRKAQQYKAQLLERALRKNGNQRGLGSLSALAKLLIPVTLTWLPSIQAEDLKFV